MSMKPRCQKDDPFKPSKQEAFGGGTAAVRFSDADKAPLPRVMAARDCRNSVLLEFIEH